MRASYVIRKLIGAVSTLAFVAVFNFFLFRVVNRNPVDSMFRGRNLTREQLDELTRKFNLDGSKWDQFVAYVRQLLRGDLGLSFRGNRPVVDVIAEALWPTVLLVGTSTLLAMIGITIGYRAGWKRGSRGDTVSTSLSMLTYSMPEFFIGMVMLGIFAASLGWFPVGGLEDPGSTATGLEQLLDQFHHMVLPALVLAIAYVGEYMIVARSAMIETLREDYLQLARAKGMRDDEVRRKHAVPNARLPVVSLSAINFGFVFSGAIAVESIFSWPGLGQATYLAVRGPDLPVLQGLFLLMSATVILANLIADLLYGVLDPRVMGR
ncbi:MAG TPA: ABC transporter permease [Acidimicrobiaceae bacterium]|nr:ABC transporter permease [Acidimicrobiaceae bacterium]